MLHNQLMPITIGPPPLKQGLQLQSTHPEDHCLKFYAELTTGMESCFVKAKI